MKTTSIRYCSLADLSDRFLRLTETRKACAECPAFGNRWSCPPFAEDFLSRFSPDARVMLIMTKIAPDNPTARIPLSEMQDMINKHKILLDRWLLPLEKKMKGLALTFTGACQHCGDSPCSRLSGDPCRHPDLARPSLEALGFDVVGISQHYFNNPIKWADETGSVDYLSLLGALIFESES